MGEEDNRHRAVALNTSLRFKEDTNVDTHMAETRVNIQARFQESFETLPDVKSTLIRVDKYVAENPQSVIFVPQKDLNMFPVLIEEAKAFAEKFETSEKLGQVRDHEFEHVQKAYELGFDIQGIGLFMFKHKGKPVFGGFVTSPKNQEIRLRDQLRILLAPKTMADKNIEDKVKVGLLSINALMKSKSPDDFEKIMSDTLFVISERYFPKRVHNYIQKSTK